MKSFVTSLFLVISSVSCLFSQSQIQTLTPQPRQAYIRAQYSATFFFKNDTYIYLDEKSPDYKAASEFNRNMRQRGLDTLTVRMGVIPDTLTSRIVIGKNTDFTSNFFPAQDQKIKVTANFPGKEGYVLDVMPMSAVIAGSDDFGLHFGIVTFFQLLDRSGTPGQLFACRVIDAPELSDRWFYYPTNFLVAANTPKIEAMCDTAVKYKMNGLLFADYKLGFIDQMTAKIYGSNRYYDSLTSFAAFCRNRFINMVPSVFAFGYSNETLVNNPNWASGLPVKKQKFVAEGDSARLVPQSDVKLSNPGFEIYNGNNFPGYNYIDGAGTYSFVDTQEKHSGNASIRFENAGGANCRMTKRFAVRQFTEFHASYWIKTQNANIGWGPHINIYDKNVSKSINFITFTVPATTNGWQRYDVTFNSLDNDTINIYFGAWNMNSGKIWFDDLLVEEIPFVNMIRRPGAPLTVTDKTGNIIYEEGKDFENFKDPKMGVVPYAGSYDAYHQPPKFSIIKSGRISNGDTLLISYCHSTMIGEDQVMCTMSDPDLYANIDMEFRILDSLIKPDRYFMSHDEIRVMNWDDGDWNRGLKPAEILADNTNKCYDIIKKYRPDAEIYDWSDMYDIFHNAQPKDYYLVNGDLRGSAELINKNIHIADWYFSKRDSTLKYFGNLGFRQMAAVYYDADENQIRQWKEAAAGTPGFSGMIYTTWANNYNYMMHFGEYAWNHPPYILHQPPTVFAHTLNLSLRVNGDKWDKGWQLGDVYLFWRTSPDSAFSSQKLNCIAGTDAQAVLNLLQGAGGVQWYFTASDNRKHLSRIPFGDTVYFELGDFSTGVEDFALLQNGLNISPNPAGDYITISVGVQLAVPEGIKIFDVFGQEYLTPTLSTSGEGVRIDVSSLSPGVYFIKIGNKVSKFLKI